MPIMRCTLKGKGGWKWGENGICYIGPDARDKARKQGLAVIAARAIKEGVKKNKISEYVNEHSDEI